MWRVRFPNMQCLQRQGGYPPVPSVIRVSVLLLAGLLGAVAPFAAREAAAQTTFPDVDTEVELRDALLSISRDFAEAHDNGPYVVTLTGNIMLSGSLPMIRARVPLDGAAHVTIEGNNHTIDAAGTGRVFFAASGRISIRNVTIANARVRGGSGGWSAMGGGGGGGLGAGAALFVNKGAEVLATNVIVQNAQSLGGRGGDFGTGLGFGDEARGGGGGGGLQGNGGNVGAPFNSVIDRSDGGGGGGGYGPFANGGNVEETPTAAAGAAASSDLAATHLVVRAAAAEAADGGARAVGPTLAEAPVEAAPRRRATRTAGSKGSAEVCLKAVLAARIPSGALPPAAWAWRWVAEAAAGTTGLVAPAD